MDVITYPCWDEMWSILVSKCVKNNAGIVHRQAYVGIWYISHNRYINVKYFMIRFLAATKQLYKWYFPSVRLSVCLSVRHTFLTMFPSSYHHEIFRTYYQWQKWRPCKRPRSEVKGQGHRGHNPTLPFPDCNSSLNSRMMMKWCI